MVAIAISFTFELLRPPEFAYFNQLLATLGFVIPSNSLLFSWTPCRNRLDKGLPNTYRFSVWLIIGYPSKYSLVHISWAFCVMKCYLRGIDAIVLYGPQPVPLRMWLDQYLFVLSVVRKHIILGHHLHFYTSLRSLHSSFVTFNVTGCLSVRFRDSVWTILPSQPTFNLRSISGSGAAASF